MKKLLLILPLLLLSCSCKQNTRCESKVNIFDIKPVGLLDGLLESLEIDDTNSCYKLIDIDEDINGKVVYINTLVDKCPVIITIDCDMHGNIYSVNQEWLLTADSTEVGFRETMNHKYNQLTEELNKRNCMPSSSTITYADELGTHSKTEWKCNQYDIDLIMTIGERVAEDGSVYGSIVVKYINTVLPIRELFCDPLDSFLED